MKCFGLIGGLGVGAAVHYYRELARMHEQANAPMELVMVHADMSRMVRWAQTRDANSMAEYLAGLIGRLRAAGADFAAIPAVTPHLCIAELLRISPLPLVNMLQVACEALRSSGFRRVALFGTRYTIDGAFFGALQGVEVARPRPEEVDAIHEIYFRLASTGTGTDGDRQQLTTLARTLMERDGVESIVLAGTDLALIFDESNTPFPHIDCARVHVDAIFREMIA